MTKDTFCINIIYTASGRVGTFQKISDTEGSFTTTLGDSNNFGEPVAALGDVNGDDTVDLAVGVNGDDDGGSDRGAVYVLFMNDNGEVAPSIPEDQ